MNNKINYDIENFIKELNELSEKYGIYIESEAYCGGKYYPYLIYKNGDNICFGNDLVLKNDFTYCVCET